MFCRSLRGRRGLRGVLFVMALASAAPASAQIYSWRDANGNLVLSNRRPESAPPASVKTYAVPKADRILATRYVAADRSGQFDDLIAEHSRRNGVRSDLVRAVVQVESA